MMQCRARIRRNNTTENKTENRKSAVCTTPTDSWYVPYLYFVHIERSRQANRGRCEIMTVHSTMYNVDTPKTPEKVGQTGNQLNDVSLVPITNVLSTPQLFYPALLPVVGFFFVFFSFFFHHTPHQLHCIEY